MTKHFLFYLMFYVVSLFLIFWIRGGAYLDPDFGWHYAMGEYIAKNGWVPHTDPFSYTMPSFHFVDHEWLMNLGMYLIYENFGMWGLSGAFSIIVVLMVIILVKPSQVWFGVLPIIMSLTVWLGKGGVRPQVFSWLMLAMLVRLWIDRNVWVKYRWLVPVWFCIWANIHGGFALSIFILAWMIFWRFIQYFSVDWRDILVWVLGTLSTLVNPYGIKLWYEVWMQISDPLLRWNIAEWQPFFASFELGFWFMCSLTVSLIWMYRRSSEWWKVTLFFGLFLAGMSSLRHMSLTMIIAAPFAIELMQKFYNQWGIGNKTREVLIKKFYLLLVGFGSVLLIWDLGWLGYGTISRDSVGIRYPVKAVEFLKENRPPGNMISEYGWGGYLIWKLPHEKVFIDGRMPSWRWQDKSLRPFQHEQSAPENESNWIFKEYLMLDDSSKHDEIFNKYNVRLALLSKEGSVVARSELVSFLIKHNLYSDNEKSLADNLSDKGWSTIYADDISVVLVRPD